MGLNPIVTHAEVENLKHVLTNHPPGKPTQDAMAAVRIAAKGLGIVILHNVRPSAEREQAIVNLRQTVFWTMAGLALQDTEQVEHMPDPNLEPTEDVSDSVVGGPSQPTKSVHWSAALNQQLTVVTDYGTFEANMSKCVDGQVYLRDHRRQVMDWVPVHDNTWVTVLD